MIKAIIFDCFGVLYPDPVFAYMRNPQIPPEKAEALHDLDEQAARSKLTRIEFIKKAAILLDKSSQEIENQFFQRHNNNQELVNFIKSIQNKYKTTLLSNIG